MFKNSYVPYGGYWSSPFCKWQSKFQNENAVKLAANTAKAWLQRIDVAPSSFDGLVVGTTVPQKQWFFAAPHFATLIGNPDISGPIMSQACATSAVSLKQAVSSIELGSHKSVLVATMDRCSNSPSLLWAKPNGLGGAPEYESWMLDGFNVDPVAEVSAMQTAENVAKEHGVTMEESNALAIDRYNKYVAATADDRAFQKRYMQPVEIRLSRKKTIVVEEDDGITPCTEEGLAKLRPVIEGGVLTFGAQTHPADGNAGMIVTDKARATAMSTDKNVTIQLLSYGHARTKKAFMAAAVTPSAEMALKNAGIKVADLAAVKTHNPFAVNDVVMGKLMGIDNSIFNNYGSSLVFGHPQGPTGMRSIVELIEELVMKGGGYGLFAGCAAGDTAAAIVLRVN